MDEDRQAERLRRMMRAYESPGHMVVGVQLEHGETRFLAAGEQASQVAHDELIFEIGSITKVFTAILLCLLVEEGKVDPQAPVSEMAAELADVPGWITPETLTSHTSGLPNIHMPIWKALIRPQPDGPYARFSRADLLAWLRRWRGRPPVARRRHAYSNLGVGLLGEAMAMHAGRPFVDLLAEKVIAPLGLKDTTGRLDEFQQGRFAQPRNTKGAAVLPWTFDALAAAGCLRSSARDLARFADRVNQALSAPETALDRAIFRSAVPILGLGRRESKEPAAQCSGWLSWKLDPAQPGFLFHNGATAGSTCTLYICPETAKALAVLSNNGVAGNLWASTKLNWSNPHRQAHGFLTES